MPKEGSVMKFKNKRHALRQPVVIYADFESIQQPTRVVHGKTVSKSKHVPAEFALVVVSDLPNFQWNPVHYQGLDAEKVFFEELNKIRDAFWKKFSVSKKMLFTKKEVRLHEEQTHCYLCHELFSPDHKKGHKVRDHCHFTGQYRGTLHNLCNLSLKRPWKIPVRLHNLTGYDSHLLVKELAQRGESVSNVDVIANNEEQYKTFSHRKFYKYDTEGTEVNRLVSFSFMDSMQHLQCSLDQLVQNLPKEKLRQSSKYFSEKKLEFFLRKGVYPYEHMDSFERFQVTEFPFEVFGSTLNQGIVYDERSEGEIEKEPITREDYEHGQKVWKEMGCKTLGDYSKLYCMSDTLLLADVFEAYRDLALDIYGLDPSYYITAPSFAIDAARKMSGAELELITDENMYLFMEEGIRGGVSVISNRYGRGNNKYMRDLHDKGLPDSFVVYLDANGLYSFAMLLPLPYKNFKWMCSKTLRKMEEDSSRIKACTLEVDLDIPEMKEFHDYTKDYPLAPESKVINGVSKLVPNLLHKRNYVVHHKEPN